MLHSIADDTVSLEETAKATKIAVCQWMLKMQISRRTSINSKF